MANLLQKVVLEVGVVVLPDDVWAREGAEELAEDRQHCGRASPAGHHRVGHLRTPTLYLLTSGGIQSHVFPGIERKAVRNRDIL